MLRNCIRVLNTTFRQNHTKSISKNKRGEYNVITTEHHNYFRGILGQTRVLTDASDLDRYTADCQQILRGTSTLVLQPKTTEEVSKILSFCNKNHLAVVIQGGNTGLMGGATPIFDEIVLSMEKMNQILHLDEDSGILTCESGCILQNVNEYLEAKNLIFPLDLGAKGSCQIGGNVSTNAGGLRLLRYGNLHGNVLGLEVVKANGEVLNCLNQLKKNNTGFHLKHLFIGSEGTLGVVTKIAVECKTKPKTLNVAFLGCENFNKVKSTFTQARNDLDEILTAFEVMDTPTMAIIKEHLGLESPIGDYPYYVLIEATGSNEVHDEDKMTKFLETCLDKHHILNGTVTADTRKAEEIWEIRETVPFACYKEGNVYSYDISLPLEHYYTIVDEVSTHLGPVAKRVFGFGHIGDGNLHLNISVNEQTDEVTKQVQAFVFEKTKEYRGSISAEHGVGFFKKKYLDFMNNKETVELMKTLKQTMDPNGILNPYKMFP